MDVVELKDVPLPADKDADEGFWLLCDKPEEYGALTLVVEPKLLLVVPEEWSSLALVVKPMLLIVPEE
jgi:hypothetical protein